MQTKKTSNLRLEAWDFEIGFKLRVSYCMCTYIYIDIYIYMRPILVESILTTDLTTVFYL